MDKIDLLKELIAFLVKEGNSQSMTEDFHDGYNHAVYQIEKFGQFQIEKRFNRWNK